MGWNTPQDWQAGLDNVGMTEHFKSMEVPASFDDVLADGNWEVIFHQFAASEFSTENIEFLRVVATYEQSPSRAVGKEIYDKYVSVDGESQVNLPGPLRIPLDEVFGEHDAAEGEDAAAAAPAEPGADIFSAAKTEVTRMTAKDTFRRF